jgi:hypothetical protein
VRQFVSDGTSKANSLHTHSASSLFLCLSLLWVDKAEALLPTLLGRFVCLLTCDSRGFLFLLKGLWLGQ